MGATGIDEMPSSPILCSDHRSWMYRHGILKADRVLPLTYGVCALQLFRLTLYLGAATLGCSALVEHGMRRQDMT